MRIAIVVEAIPPYCGGGEQVAWVHAVEMSKDNDVAVVTFGDACGEETRDGVRVHFLPRYQRNLAAYSTIRRKLLNACLDGIAPEVIHCHMPNVLSACLKKRSRLLVATIHDGVPENELLELKSLSRGQWFKFKTLRRLNVGKSDAITCVSRHNLQVMKRLYAPQAEKFSFVPNPIAERFFAPVKEPKGGYILNFGRQIPLKMRSLLDAARQMPELQFKFVGTGEMVGDYGLRNVEFVGFSEDVQRYIDEAALCVFPSRSENFPLVGLEAMARGRAVIATRRGFSEYIQHMRNGFLLDSSDPAAVKEAISSLLGNPTLRSAIEREARTTAESFRPSAIVRSYLEIYQALGCA